jgi:hypothetical protein
VPWWQRRRGTQEGNRRATPHALPSKKKPDETRPDDEKKPKLTPQQIQQGMAATKRHVQRCAEEHGGKGLVRLQLVIAPSGAVKSVGLHRSVSGTALGECVRGAVKQAKFAAFTGGEITIEYPFLLR